MVDDKGSPWGDPSAGFIVKHIETDSGSFIEETDASKCMSLLDEPARGDTVAVKVAHPYVLPLFCCGNGRKILLCNSHLNEFRNKENEKQSQVIPIDKTRPEGFYTVVFLNCQPGTYVSFDVRRLVPHFHTLPVRCSPFVRVPLQLTLTNYNPGPNYLSAGLTALPTLYAMLFVVWTVILGVWLFHFMRGQG